MKEVAAKDLGVNPMSRFFSLAVIAATLGACASAPMTASNDDPAMRALLTSPRGNDDPGMQALLTSPRGNDDPAMQALLTSPRGNDELAGLPFDMVELLQARIGFELTPTDATKITFATNQALEAGTPGAEFLWASPDNINGGKIHLWRLDAMGDGRICAILQHEHVMGDGTVQGNVTTCRREGVGWWLENWEWIITGRDFGGL